VLVDNIVFGSPASKAGLDLDWEIHSLQIKNDRPAKQWVFIPALLVFALIVILQRRRRKIAVAGENNV